MTMQAVSTLRITIQQDTGMTDVKGADTVALAKEDLRRAQTKLEELREALAMAQAKCAALAKEELRSDAELHNNI